MAFNPNESMPDPMHVAIGASAGPMPDAWARWFRAIDRIRGAFNSSADITAANTAAHLFPTIPLGNGGALLTGNYTLVADDAQKAIASNVTGYIATIPSNASVPYAVGTVISFVFLSSTGSMPIALTTDTMYLAGKGTTGTRTLGPWGFASAWKYASTAWLISGNNLT